MFNVVIKTPAFHIMVPGFDPQLRLLTPASFLQGSVDTQAVGFLLPCMGDLDGIPEAPSLNS